MPTDNDDIKSVSDEILEQASSYIKELLKNKRLKTEVRAQLEINSYFLSILAVDHEKLNSIYPYVESRRRKDQKNAERWEKLAWIVIPIAVTGVIAFVTQFIYFWLEIVPKIGV